MRVGCTLVYNCYCSSNCTVDEYRNLLAGLEEDVRGRQARNIIVGGYFNARLREWGLRAGDRRCELLLELAASLGLGRIVNFDWGPGTSTRVMTPTNWMATTMTMRTKTRTTTSEEKDEEHEYYYYYYC